MRVTQEEVVDRQAVLDIELEDGDVDQYLDRGYRRIVQRMQIPGFRKGKAPRRIVEQYVGRQGLLSEVLDYMLPDVTHRAIEDQEIEATGLPRIELVEIDPLKVKATVPLTPEIDLGSYRDIRMEPEIEEVSDEDVKQRLEDLQNRLASWEPVERPSQMSDMVTMKIVGAIEERTLIEDDSAVFILDEQSAGITPDFAENLVGLAPGESRDFSVTLASDYPDSSVAGKEARFSVTIEEIKGRVVPELDDDFAKSVGEGYESLDALRDKVREDLQTEAEHESDMRFRESVVKAVVDGAQIEFAPIIIEHEVARLEEERNNILERANIRADDYLRSIGKTEEEMRGELQQQALEKLNSAFVLTKVREQENVEVSDDEVEERLKTLTEGSTDRPNEDALRDSVRHMLMTEKTIARLVDIAKGEADSDDTPTGETTEDGNQEETEHDGGSLDDTSA